MRRIIAFLTIFCVVFGVQAADKPLRLATTTSTYETGLLDKIIPPFEKKNGVKVHIISVGTGKAIKLGANGDVDVILVHARAAEDKFVKSGNGINRKDVMYNDFVLLGPVDDPAGVFGMTDIVKAMKNIQTKKSVFISRGDDSGTNKKELIIWSKAKIKPSGSWYHEVGQGMSATLHIADEKKGYVLIDRATYLFNRKKIELKLAVEGDAILLNPYGVIAVNPAVHKHVDSKMSIMFIDWMVSSECQKMINNFKVEGTQLYHPNAKQNEKEEKK